MKHSHSKIASIIIPILIMLLFTSVTSAQTSCDGWNHGVTGGGISGYLDQRLDQFCNSSPQDTLLYYGDGLVVTRRNVYTRGVSGGTATCTNYPKQIILEFSRPIADFYSEVFGAKTVTANTGETFHFSPELLPEGTYAPGRPIPVNEVSFSGGGITSITISDPFEYPVYYGNNSLYANGGWEMWYANARFNSEQRHNECHCSSAPIAKPPTQDVSSPWAFDLDGTDPNWSMLVEVTDNDGLVLRDIKLGQRYMAEKISVPYFYLETSALTSTRGELRPDGTEPTMHSRLV